MLKTVFDMSTTSMLPTLRPVDKSWVALTSLLKSSYLRGYPIRWREVYDASVKYLRPFPHYPLEGADYVVPFRDPAEVYGAEVVEREPLDPPFEFLNSKGAPSNTKPGVIVFDTPIKQLAPFIKAHAVGSVPLCPASIFMEFALEGAAMADGPIKTPITMQNITFHSPLLYTDEGSKSKVQLELAPGPEHESRRERTFIFRSENGEVHCNGIMRGGIPRDVKSFFSRKGALVKRQKTASFEAEGKDKPSDNNSFSSRTIYELIFPRVVAYADPFLTLDRLTVGGNGLEGYGQFRLDGPAVEGCFVCPPAFIDTMLHAAGFIANIQVDEHTACICTKIDQAMLPGDSQELYSRELDIYCSLVEVEDSIVGDAYVMTADQKVVACVEGMAFKKIPKEPFKARLTRSAKQMEPAAEAKRRDAPPAKAQRHKKAPSTTSHASTAPSVPDIEATVHTMLREVCGAGAAIEASMTLAEMGVDSLLFIELTQAIKSQLPQLDVPREELESCETVGDLVAVMQKGSATLSPTSTAPSTAPSTAAPHSTHESSAAASTPMTPPDSVLRVDSLLAEVCGVDSVDKSAPLSSLGIDSLLTIELLDELKRQLGVVIDPGDEGISDLTIEELEALCSKKSGTNPSAQQSHAQGDQEHAPPPKQKKGGLFGGLGEEQFPAKLQQQQTGEPKSSLYLFHDGSGLCSMYRKLQEMNRNVYGIFSLDGLSGNDAQNMEELASLYIERAGLADKSNILLGGKFSLSGPVRVLSLTLTLLSGWSFGGVLAYEVSRQLRDRGVPVKGVVLIDSPVPVDHDPLPQEVIEHVVGAGASNKARKRSGIRDRVEVNFARHAAMLQQYSKQASRNASRDAIPCAMLHCSRIMDTEALCGVSYPWLNDSEFRNMSIDGWGRLLHRRLLVLDLDCNHFEVFESAKVCSSASRLIDASIY